MSPMRPAVLVASFLFAVLGLTGGTGGLPLEALAQEAFIGAQGAVTAPAPPSAAPYRPGLAPTLAPEQAPAHPAPPIRPAVTTRELDLLDQGEFAAASGRFAEAERLWRLALAQNPDWGAVKRRLAELPHRRAVFSSDLAQQEQRRAARLALVEGVTRFNARQYQEAAQHFQHYLAVFPEDTEIRAYLDLALGQGASLLHGALRIACEPKAEVLLDGRLVGLTPLTIPQVAKGSHRVEVRAHGGSQAKVIEIKGGTTEVSFRLLGGFVSVNAQPWAEVLLDGTPVGQTPLTLENLLLGSHIIGARHPGLPEQSRQVFLEAGQTPALHFNLSPR